MTDAIIKVLEWMNDTIIWITDGQGITGTLSTAIPLIYEYVEKIMNLVAQPVAYVILSLFLVLEIYHISVQAESMGGQTLSAELVFKSLIKFVCCKAAIDSISVILNGIYNVTSEMTLNIQDILAGSSVNGLVEIDALRTSIDSLEFWPGFVALLVCFIVFLVVIVAVVIAKVLVTARFIQIYVYFAFAPIPIATFPSNEQSQIGKNFLKSFTAVCLQGVLIFVILTMFPILVTNAFISYDSSLEIFGALMGVLGYCVVLILALFSSSQWAKSICNAM